MLHDCGMRQHYAYWLDAAALLSHPKRNTYSCPSPSNTFSPARIATFSRFSFGGMGQLQRGL